MRPPVNLALKVGVLLLALTAMVFGVPTIQAGQAGGLTRPAQYEEESGSGGSLQIRIQSEDGAQYPPGDLLLSDPSDRRRFSRQLHLSGIPGATYRGETVSSRQQGFRLYVDNAISGTYSLRVIGVDYGRYNLSMKGSDREGNQANLLYRRLAGGRGAPLRDRIFQPGRRPPQSAPDTGH